MTTKRTLGILALLLANFVVGVAQQAPPGIVLRPLPPPSTQVANQGQAIPPRQAVDPRLGQVGRWLRTQIANVPAGRAGVLAAAPAAPDPTLETRKRDDGTAFEIKKPLRKFARPIAPNARRQRAAGAEQTAREFLRAQKPDLRIDDTEAELSPVSTERDTLGREHVRFAQRHEGIPVWPCELTVHLDQDGEVDLVNGAFIATPRGLGTTPRLTSGDAVARAQQELFQGRGVLLNEPEIIVYGPLHGAPRLAWKFSLAQTEIDGKRCVIDALDGRVLSAISLTQDDAVTGSGIDALGVTRTLNLWQQGSSYYMVNTTEPMYDPSSRPPSPSNTRGVITILDARNRPASSNPQGLGDPVLSISSSPSDGWVRDAVSAAYALSEVYDYYYFTHERNSLDNQKESITAIVRLGVNFPNAFWSGQSRVMAFGDGFSRSLDVCGHELTHGVLDSIGDGGILEYHDQPGALNEAFADIFGECVEARTRGATDWLVGSDLGFTLRNLAHPASVRIGGTTRHYPETMSEFIRPDDPFLDGFSGRDHGGVHLNSSIPGHCFYLLAEGMSGAIGLNDASRVFYRAMTVHLQKQSQFIDARRACIAAAEELFGTGSTQARKTAEAFDAVEIFDAPPTPPPSTIPPVAASDSTMAFRWSTTGQGYYLVRREAARGDGNSGTFVNTVAYLYGKRVSISGDGRMVVFVTEGHDFGLATTDGSFARLAGFPGLVHSAALSPDARFVALVLQDENGFPTDQISILDLDSDDDRTYSLYATSSEGDPLRIVDYADVMDFTVDGQRLIYDASCSFLTSDGDVFSGWTIFSLDRDSGRIATLVDLNSDFDIGNPALGNVHNNLVVFEATDSLTGISTEVAGDLFTGRIGVLGTVSGLGLPGYNGDDTAVVYSRRDTAVPTAFSLVRQPVARDGITRSGPASTWLANADFGVIYRRGVFVTSNAAPSVSILNMTNGQILTTPGSFTIQASANDPDGSVSRMEFFDGATKIGTDASVPFSVVWKNPMQGSHRMVARAIDNLGGATDSDGIEVFVYPPCSYSLSPTAQMFGAAGGAGTISIACGFWCDWNAISRDSWITILGIASGRGTGVVSFIVADNPTASPRSGQIQIGGLVFAVAQSPPETNKPIVTISSPPANARVTELPLLARGVAKDKAGIASVKLRVDTPFSTTDYQTAEGTTAWTFSVNDLSPGTNILRVRAIDLNGNLSDEIRLPIFRVQPSPLNLIIDGSGTVSPYRNGQSLELGFGYKLTATAGLGYVFSNWTGTVSSRSPMLTFVLETNTIIHANFVPNPFLPIKGAYSGLFRETDAVRHESSGYFNLTLSDRGAYSGSLLLAGGKYPVSGRFDLELLATNIIERPGLSAVTVTWRLDPSAGKRIIGLVSTAPWEASLEGDLAPSYTTLEPSPLTGKYTMAIAGVPGVVDKPEGDGVGTATITPKGKLTFAGTLADGAKVTQSLSPSSSGSWPLYASLSRGRGSLWSRVAFDTGGPQDDLHGALNWTRPPGASPTYYTNGFVLDSVLSGSRYTPPAAGMRVLGFAAGNAVLAGGNLAQSYTNKFALGASNRLTNEGPHKLTMSFTPASGLFTGTFTPVGGTKAVSFRGVVLPRENVGTGHVLGTNRIGRLRLLPSP